MRVMLLAVALFAVLACTFQATSSCAGPKTRDAVLTPAVLGAWPDVKADIERGIAHAVERFETDGALETLALQRLDLAITNEVIDERVASDWTKLFVFGLRGIQARVDSGEIPPSAAPPFRDRLSFFGEALSRYL